MSFLGCRCFFSLDFSLRTLRLHDVIRHFVQADAGQERVLGGVQGQEIANAADRRYFYQHLPYHLSVAGDRAGLDALLLDPTWMRDKLAATGGPQYLISDYRQYGQGSRPGPPIRPYLVFSTDNCVAVFCRSDYGFKALPSVHRCLRRQDGDA
jgi:hypothetical protein